MLRVVKFVGYIIMDAFDSGRDFVRVTAATLWTGYRHEITWDGNLKRR